jgi:N-acetylglucosamine-6-sulfatase
MSVFRSRLTGLIAVTATIVAGLSSCASISNAPDAETSASPHHADSRPNVVLILTDDMRQADLFAMPKTRALLAARGMTFPNAINPHPLCCPARAELGTAQYAQNNGVHSNMGPYGGYQAYNPKKTLATWMKDSGYNTAFLGKHLNEYDPHKDGRDPGWTVWDPTMNAGVYDMIPGRYAQWNDGHLVKPKVHVTDYLGNASVRTIKRFAAQDKPFFIFDSYIAPHDSWWRELDDWGPPRPPARFAGTHSDAPFLPASKPNFNEADMSDKAGFVKTLPKRSVAKLTRYYRARLDALAAVDENVAKTIKTLDETGELTNTVIIFTSDNGYSMGEHRWDFKTLAFEEDLRVPLIVSGPGIKPGSTNPEAANTVDIASTIADLGNTSPTRLTDGQSLVPILHGTRTKRLGDTTLIQAGAMDFDPSVAWLFRGVRTARYTFTYWPQAHEYELYDRLRDPWMMNSVDADPRYAVIKTELMRRTRMLGACSGESACNQTFGPLPQPLPRS